MKYEVVHRGDPLSQQLSETFLSLADQQSHLERNTIEPELVLTIGGDGTLLEAFHRYQDRLADTAFLGIHTGHLGFYADWMPDEIENLARTMGQHAHTLWEKTVHYPLVEISLTTPRGEQRFLALNECTIKGVESTLVAQLTINDMPFETFRGDGICIATPSGSTGYNKSLNGAIIHPAFESIQITEIASINNRVYRTLGSAVILPRHHHCDILPQNKKRLLITVDHVYQEINDIQSIRFNVAEEKVNFVRFRPFPFWSRVREAFIGNDSHSSKKL